MFLQTKIRNNCENKKWEKASFLPISTFVSSELFSHFVIQQLQPLP